MTWRKVSDGMPDGAIMVAAYCPKYCPARAVHSYANRGAICKAYVEDGKFTHGTKDAPFPDGVVSHWAEWPFEQPRGS